MRARPSLSPELIIDAASRLAATSGAEALTVRRLGKELGADPTAVYRHFRDRDEIVLEVADRLIGQIIEELPAGLPWRERLDWLGRALVRTFVGHPAIAPTVAMRTTRRPGEFRTVEVILGALREAGLGDRQAAVHHRVFADTLLSYAGMCAGYATLEERSRRGDESAWAREYQQLPAADYPNIAAVRPHFATVDDDVVLTGLLGALLDMIEREATSQRR